MDNKLRQSDVAKMLGVREDYVTGWENRNVIPSKPILLKLKKQRCFNFGVLTEK